MHICRHLVSNGLAYAATIQLHKNFASVNINSNEKCVTAASAMVIVQNSLDLSKVVNVHPIMGVRMSDVPVFQG